MRCVSYCSDVGAVCGVAYRDSSSGKATGKMAETRFLFRKKLDGSFDSICMTCFATVTTGASEKELEKPDSEHVCEPSVMTQRAGDYARRSVDNTPAVDSRHRVYQEKVLSPMLFTVFVLMAVVTTAVTAPLLAIQETMYSTKSIAP